MVNNGVVNPVLRQSDIWPILQDRRWHSLIELVAMFKTSITPERASWTFINRTSKSDTKVQHALEPFEVRVAHGRRLVVEGVMIAMIGSKKIERRGAGNEKEYRLIEWWCWSCGERQADDSGRPFSTKCCEKCDDLFSGPKRDDFE